MKEILVPIFKNGQCVYDSPSVMEIQKTLQGAIGNDVGRIKTSG